MKKSLNILIILLLLYSFTVNAAPPIRNVVLPLGQSLVIEIPIFEYYPFNISNKIHFHIYNYSGQICTTVTTKCNIHIYNTTNHIVEDKLFGDSNGYEFYYPLNNSINNRYGIYSVLVDCNKTGGEYGFNEFGFQIVDFTSKRYPVTNGEDTLNFLVFIPYLIAILFLIMAFSFQNNEPFKWFFRLLSLVMIFPVYIITDILVNQNSFFTPLKVIFSINIFTSIFFTIFGLLLVILIINIFNHIADKKQNELEDGEFKK